MTVIKMRMTFHPHLFFGKGSCEVIQIHQFSYVMTEQSHGCIHPCNQKNLRRPSSKFVIRAASITLLHITYFHDALTRRATEIASNPFCKLFISSFKVSAKEKNVEQVLNDIFFLSEHFVVHMYLQFDKLQHRLFVAQLHALNALVTHFGFCIQTGTFYDEMHIILQKCILISIN